jgi:hypothetical protein
VASFNGRIVSPPLRPEIVLPHLVIRWSGAGGIRVLAFTMERMERALVVDEKTGNALLAFLPAEQVSGVPGDAPMPAALVALWCGKDVLLVFDRFRRQWELPGGRIDPGEGPCQAAVRELQEESGLHVPDLTFAGYARVWLTGPPHDNTPPSSPGRSRFVMRTSSLTRKSAPSAGGIRPARLPATPRSSMRGWRNSPGPITDDRNCRSAPRMRDGRSSSSPENSVTRSSRF